MSNSVTKVANMSHPKFIFVLPKCGAGKLFWNESHFILFSYQSL